MIRNTLQVRNNTGLHARPVSAIVKTVTRHQSTVTFIFNGKEIKGKSVIGLMTAGISCNAVLDVICDGPDEQTVYLALQSLFNSGFGE